MNQFRKINIISGWSVFLISAVVYLITKEPTASFWDCGEFIAAAYKMEVGHPPGAPFFMLLSRLFSLFASSPATVAKWINTLSALASALTIAFLFWTITHLARKMLQNASSMKLPDVVMVIGAGLVGSLGYTFSDTFWFSAVEAEVYATSSLFTAVVFWAILKWENVADQPHSNRWIILIAYLMGLSIGVHLLNLLAIPAIIFVYYFKKYKPTRNGVLASLGLSFLILAIFLYGVIPGVVKVAGVFELIAVNGIGMPFNSGTFIFVLAVAGGLAYLIHRTHRQRKIVLNTILVSFTVILIGYSSYGVILIRAAANTPMEQNDPETVFSLLSYLNREQYGQNPLLSGHYYNAPMIDGKEGRPVRSKVDGRYEVTSHRQQIVYDDRFKTIFPRMWSSAPEHASAYEEWGRIEGTPVSITNRNGETEVLRKPTFTENLRFFFRYQVGHMYLRYFMWNFAGRQNDMQSHGEVFKGNWLSGIPMIDEARLGPQDQLPPFLRDNKARNRLYLLPLMLGIAGLIFHYRKHRPDFWVVTLLFLMTGLAIVVFLNQYPFQPRERDYAYAGSFYAFAIWMGLGSMAFAAWARKKLPGVFAPLAVTLTCLLLVPGNMLKENWDDHDRSGRLTTRAFASNYLNSCAPNAILFTNGDNDTFPLWYVQEVEGIRTDVRVVNLSYLGADWYIQQVSRAAYDSEAVPFAMGIDLYRTGKRDIIYLIDRIEGYVDLSEAMDFLRSEDQRTKSLRNLNERVDHLPSRNLVMPIDSAHIIRTGTVRPEQAHLIEDEFRIQLPGSSLRKNGMMVLDLLDNNNWERPVYYAVTVSNDLYLNLQDYFQLQGLTYRIVPIRQSESSSGHLGSIDTDILYENMINKFQWGGIEDTSLYLDENNRRMLTNFRNNFGRLAGACLADGDTARAVKVLDHCMKVIPEQHAPLDFFMLPIIETYYQTGSVELATAYARRLAAQTAGELDYFFSLPGENRENLDYELQVRLHVMQEVMLMAERHGQMELFERQQQKFQELIQLYQSFG